MSTIAEEISSLLQGMSPVEQARVLRIARELAHPPTYPRTSLPPGTPGYIVAQLRVSPEAGAAIEEALEDTERVWPDE
jgi:hypothetical protein